MNRYVHTELIAGDNESELGIMFRRMDGEHIMWQDIIDAVIDIAAEEGFYFRPIPYELLDS